MTTTQTIGVSGPGTLRLNRVGKVFPPKGREAGGATLQDVDLAVSPGEFISVVGSSGCGKTTLIRMIHGLIPKSAGSISVDGDEVDKPDITRGFVFQSDSLLPWRTVLRNIAFGLEMQGLPRVERKRRAMELAAAVGLAGYEHHYPSEISGGMRQRANIARALAIDPKILLMDEPFAALDAQTREAMQVELLRIWSEQKTTVIFITHQIDEAVFLSDRVVILGNRPATVRDIVEVPLPRPRRPDMRSEQSFQDLVSYIRERI
jgi:NitT/TauT family transport system ATP-binding protein